MAVVLTNFKHQEKSFHQAELGSDSVLVSSSQKRVGICVYVSRDRVDPWVAMIGECQPLSWSLSIMHHKFTYTHVLECVWLEYGCVGEIKPMHAHTRELTCVCVCVCEGSSCVFMCAQTCMLVGLILIQSGSIL